MEHRFWRKAVVRVWAVMEFDVWADRAARTQALSRWSNDTRVSCPDISQSLAAAAASLACNMIRAGAGDPFNSEKPFGP